jgi:hypothetical protein
MCARVQLALDVANGSKIFETTLTAFIRVAITAGV